MRHYVMTIQTRGPVHIGDGHTLGKKDYFQRNGKIAVLDAPRFVAQLNEGQLERYCGFLEDDDPRKGLQDFLGEGGSALKRIAQRSVAYEVNSSLSTNRGGNRQHFEVQQFVKDAYGKPYIPGSSVKGMLRTALLATLIAKDRNRDRYRSELNGCRDSRDYERLSRKIETNVLYKPIKSSKGPEESLDVMHFVSVADSDPLEPSALVFAKKYDKFSMKDNGHHKHDMRRLSDDDYYEGNAIDIYRECLTPGTTITVNINVDERIDSYLGLTLDDAMLTLILRIQERLYEDCFLRNFDLTDVEDVNSGSASERSPDDGICRYVYQSGPLAGRRCRNKAVGNTGYCNTHKQYVEQPSTDAPAGNLLPCYLGGGVGFDNKTVVNAILLRDSRRVDKVAHILYGQFPSRFDYEYYANLAGEVSRKGFEAKSMKARFNRSGKLQKAKDDHRHWKDPELGVSPHTLKLGIVDGKKYQMGLCGVAFQER